MQLSLMNCRKLDQVPDEDGARRLAEEMQMAGEESLSIDVEESPIRSLKFLEQLSFVKYLEVGGKARQLETIGALTGLRELRLLRVTVADFKFLSGFNELRLFEMRCGGCKSFESLSAAKRLIGLSFHRIPGLRHLEFVKSMPELQLLEVNACRAVSRLPDFSFNPELRKLILESMNGLASLKNIEKANQLEYLIALETKTLPADEFKRVGSCPMLRKVLVGPDLVTSARYRQAVSYVPAELRMDAYYGTEFEQFTFRGYEQSAVSV